MFFRKSVLGLCWLNVNYITFKASIEVWGMMLSCHTLWQNSKKTSHFNKGIYHFKQFSFSNVGSEVCYLEIRRFYVLTHEKWSAQILFLNVKSFNWTVSNRALFFGAWQQLHTFKGFWTQRKSCDEFRATCLHGGGKDIYCSSERKVSCLRVAL